MKKYILLIAATLILGVSLILTLGADQNAATNAGTIGASNTEGLEVATFAGGCFWCVESTFEKIDGVARAVSGYAGGTTEDPTYRKVGAGGTGHTETVQIYYDPEIVSYPALLHWFWREIDPTDDEGQFVDRGGMYRPAIFYHSEKQKQQIEQSMEALAASGRYGKPLKVEVLPFDTFWDAEGYHQDYYKKSPLRYKVYRRGSGRDQYLEKVWGPALTEPYQAVQTDSTTENTSGAQSEAAASEASNGFIAAEFVKPDDDTLKEMLTPIQYKITQRDGTERAYSNTYWDNKEPGIYVDVVSGEPLFSSADKYDSKTGWPSFSKPVDDKYITTQLDFLGGMIRTEVRSKYGDSHLGHIFKDGPAPTGLRYCINSAALRFIPATELASQGYSEFQTQFTQ